MILSDQWVFLQLKQLSKQFSGMHGHACVHSVPVKALFFGWYRLAKRNDFDVSGNVKSLDEMISTNIFIYKQDIQHSEADKTHWGQQAVA